MNKLMKKKKVQSKARKEKPTFYVMSLDPVEQKSYEAFTDEHYSKHKFQGGVPVTLTPTGIALHVEVRCPSCNETKDISNYDSW
jgi:hypothetical protein